MPSIHAGSLLLAEPYLLDSNFKRAAIGIVDHHDAGSVGFVLNHPLNWRVTDVIEGFPAFDSYLSYGGPVQRDTLHFLHKLSGHLDDTQQVVGDLYWGGDFEQLTNLAEEGIAHPGNVKFYLGYSGWSEGQLKQELTENTWVVSELTEDLVFDISADDVWPRAMRRIGDAYGVIGGMEEESLN